MNTSRKPVTIEPAQIVREKSGLIWMYSIQLKNIYLLLRTLLLSGFLASIAIAIGLYSYRVYENNPHSFIDVMDSVFKQSPPPVKTIQVTAISGIIFAVIFYGEYVRSQLRQVQDRLSDLAKFFAGIVLIIGVDILIYKIDFYRWAYRNIYPPQLLSVIAGQVVSIIFIIMLLPAFRKFVMIAPISQDNGVISDRNKKLFSNIQYYLVSLMIILLITYLSAANFKDREYFNYLGLSLPVVRSGVFLVAIGFAVLFNHPPKSLNPVQSFTFLRFVFGILCLFGIGFFYSQTSNSEMYLVYALVAFILSWLSKPVVVLLS